MVGTPSLASAQHPRARMRDQARSQAHPVVDDLQALRLHGVRIWARCSWLCCAEVFHELRQHRMGRPVLGRSLPLTDSRAAISVRRDRPGGGVAFAGGSATGGGGRSCALDRRIHDPGRSGPRWTSGPCAEVWRPWRMPPRRSNSAGPNSARSSATRSCALGPCWRSSSVTCPMIGAHEAAVDAAQAFADGAERTKALRDSGWAAHRAAQEARDAGQAAASDAARAAGHAVGAAFLHPLADGYSGRSTSSGRPLMPRERWNSPPETIPLSEPTASRSLGSLRVPS